MGPSMAAKSFGYGLRVLTGPVQTRIFRIYRGYARFWGASP